VTGAILRFFLFFTLVYISLWALFSLTPVGHQYHSLLNNTCQSLFGTFAGTGAAEFDLVQAASDPNEKMRIKIYNAEEKRTIEQKVKMNPDLAKTLSYNGSVGHIHLWVFATLPLLFLWALIISSPVNFRRKIWSILLGTVILQCFVFLKFYLYMLKEFNQNDILDVVYLKAGSERLVNFSYNLFENIGIALVLAVILWAMFTFKGADFAKFSKLLKPQ
jgi:hypothetical protein